MFLLGLGFFGLAAWKWLGVDDPFPGYGDLERRRRKGQQTLDERRDDILQDLDERLVTGRNKVKSIFKDPVERWDASIAAIRERERLFSDRGERIHQESTEAGQAIAMYRIANRQARPADSMAPSHWTTPYKHVSEPLQPPPEIRIRSLDYALDLREKELRVLRSCYSRLNRTHDACACRILAISYIYRDTSPRSVLELESEVEEAEIVDVVHRMGSRDGTLGIPNPDHAGLSISETSIHKYYSAVLFDKTKCYRDGVQAQADLMDSRLLTNSTNRTADCEQQKTIGQIAQAELQAINKEVYAGLADLHDKAQDAVDSFQKVQAVRELARVEKASGSDGTTRSNMPSSDYSPRRSASDKAVAALGAARDQALTRLTDSYNQSRERLESAFQNPVEAWRATDRAVRECRRLYAVYTLSVDQLRAQCREAVDLYRTANMEARRDGLPPPVHWSDTVEVDFRNPELPPDYDLCSFEVAKQIHQKDQLELDTQLNALTACYNGCHDQVMRLTELYNG